MPAIMGSLRAYRTLPTWLPLAVQGLHLKIPRSDTLQMASSSSGPLGLQVPVLFKALWSHLYSASRGGHHASACARLPIPEGSLRLSIALYVHGSSASTSPANVELGATSYGSAFLTRRPSMSESSVMWLGVFKCAGCCAALCRSDSTPSRVSIPAQVCQVVAAQGEKKGFGAIACSLSALGKTNFCSP